MGNYFNIVKNSTSNGVGLRTSVFLSGCTLHCKGCFNYKAWDFNSGYKIDDKFYKEIGDSLKNDYIDGITILGGEPMDIQNLKSTFSLISQIKKDFPNKTIWLYTGYYIKDLDKNNETIHEILKNVDVVVDGPWVENLWDINLKFRGSSNQTIWEKDKKGEFIKSDLN